MREPIVRSIAVTTHGRFLVDLPAEQRGGPLLVGFHGYGENAERHLDELRRVPGARSCVVVAVQGLHRFYTGKTQDIAASWMTRQDREEAIADNIAYVNAVVQSVSAEHEPSGFVFVGFSQGVAMAYRAAAFGDFAASAVIALGGDLPPDVRNGPHRSLPPVLIGRGTRDTWYTEQRLVADVADLRAAGVEVEALVYEGGHEWTDAFREAAGRFLATVRTRGEVRR